MKKIMFNDKLGLTQAVLEGRKTQTRRLSGGGNPELSRFTPRQLMAELKARGYTGELKYVQTINIETL